MENLERRGTELPSKAFGSLRRKPSPKAFESHRKPSKAIAKLLETFRKPSEVFGMSREIRDGFRRLSGICECFEWDARFSESHRDGFRRKPSKAIKSHREVTRDIPKTFGGFRNVSRNSRRLLNAFGGFQISRSTEVAPLRIQGWHTQISGLSCCWLPGSWLAPGWLLVGSWLAAG
jgi:hypothetical protein